MSTNREQYARTLGIDPSPRGFAFAVIEGSGRLVDWGTIECPNRRPAHIARRLDALISRYSPAAVATEDYSRSRRGSRARKMADCVVGYCRLREIAVFLPNRSDVRRTLVLSEESTKYTTACAIVERFPELARILPPKRKPWKSEDSRMNVFDAVGLAASAVTANCSESLS